MDLLTANVLQYSADVCTCSSDQSLLAYGISTLATIAWLIHQIKPSHLIIVADPEEARLNSLPVPGFYISYKNEII